MSVDDIEPKYKFTSNFNYFIKPFNIGFLTGTMAF